MEKNTITVTFTADEFEIVKQVMEFYGDTVADLNFGEKPEDLESVLRKLKEADLER